MSDTINFQAAIYKKLVTEAAVEIFELPQFQLFVKEIVLQVACQQAKVRENGIAAEIVAACESQQIGLYRGANGRLASKKRPSPALESCIIMYHDVVYQYLTTIDTVGLPRPKLATVGNGR